MSTGVVTTITTDWRGDTLEAATTSATTVLSVSSVVDFDEDGGWLVVGDSAPKAYLTVDEDTNIVTLAAAVGAVYELGLPVNLWDPTVGTGARVVEYVATVELHDGSGAVDAVIPHATIPTSGVEYLIGASVRIAEADDGEWYVDEVLGREVQLDGGLVAMPISTAETGKRVVMTSENNGAVLFYTGSPLEDAAAPGYITSSESVIGSTTVLQTALAGPRLTGTAARPTMGMSSQVSDGVYTTYVAVNADRLNFNGDRIESTNLFLTAAPTTSGAANANIGPGGQIRESTSSERFKTDIRPANIDLDAVRRIVVSTWLDRSEVEDDPTTATRYVGVTAEHLHSLGLEVFVTYDENGEPWAVQYDRLFAAVLALVQDQDDRLGRLEQRVARMVQY